MWSGERKEERCRLSGWGENEVRNVGQGKCDVGERNNWSWRRSCYQLPEPVFTGLLKQLILSSVLVVQLITEIEETNHCLLLHSASTLSTRLSAFTQFTTYHRTITTGANKYFLFTSDSNIKICRHVNVALLQNLKKTIKIILIK